MAPKEKVIIAEILVDAELIDVWDAWTTEAGERTFFAPECNIDLRPGGAYEMYFSPESPPGLRGGEGCWILAVQPTSMLSFTWNAPPGFPEVRGHFTHVLLRLYPEINGTRVTLHHDGWGTGGQWDQAFSYFTAAWLEVVLPRIQYRFIHGSMDWENTPDLKNNSFKISTS